MAMSDDDRDDAAVATLNANVADRAPGSLVSLKDAVLSIGTVFGFEGDARKVVDACVDAPDDKDLKGAEGADTAVHASDTSTAGSEDEDLEEDEEAYAYSDDAPDYDSDVDVGDTAGPNDNTAVSGELNSDQLTRLYQNKRKCVEREERRVARKTQNEGGSVETWDMKAAARNQIFSSRGAFTRLSSELFALQVRLLLHLRIEPQLEEWPDVVFLTLNRSGWTRSWWWTLWTTTCICGTSSLWGASPPGRTWRRIWTP